MKSILKLITFACIIIAFAACNKVDDLPLYSTGTAGTLTASSLLVAPVVADSNKTALTLNWTMPTHSADSNTLKYVVEIDSVNRSFSKAYRKTISGKLSTTFLAKELNAILLDLGFAYDKAYDMEIRLISSYANNNERLASNTIKVNIKTYKVPPKVIPPVTKTLFLVGNASAGGWDNPVPAAAQKFTTIDSVTYEGTFYMNGGKQFLLLPVNTNTWDVKYSVANNTVAGLNAGGNFGMNLNDNFPGPAKTGMYKIRVDFQRGIFSITTVKLFGLLYVPGDYQGWTPATAPALGSPNNDGVFEGYINIPAGGSNKFKFTTAPDWSNALGDAGNGTLSGSGGDLSVPGPGYYRIEANTVANTWAATKTTWGMIGSFAASNWSNDVPMTYSAADNKWTGTITTAAGNVFKFRANKSWTLNYGDDNGKGSLTNGGGDIGDASKNFAIPAGTHKVTLYLNNAGYYTYTVD